MSVLVAWVLLLGALALDWSGIGIHAARDRYAAVLAVLGLSGMSCAAGWPAVAVLAPPMLSGGVIAAAVVAAIAVHLALGGGARPQRRVHWPLWAAALLFVVALPAGHGLLALPWYVMALPWARERDLIDAVTLGGVFLVVWLLALGWRPHMIVIHSPAGVWQALSDAFSLVRRDSDSESDSDSGRDRSRPVGAVGEPVQVADGVWMDGYGEHHELPGPVATWWDWGNWRRRMWSWSAPVARAGRIPDPVGRVEPWKIWMRDQLLAGAPPTQIVRHARATWGMGVATWWRRHRMVRSLMEKGQL